MKHLLLSFMLLVGSLAGYAQSILSVSPAEAKRNENASIYIECLNTSLLQSDSIVVSIQNSADLSILKASTVYVIDDDYCLANISIPSSATVGTYSLSIATTNNGTFTKADAFIVNSSPPNAMLIGTSPRFATNGQYVDVTIKGLYTNFLSASYIYVSLQGATTYLSSSDILVENDSTLVVSLAIPDRNRTDTCQFYVSVDNITLYLNQKFIIKGINPKLVSVNPDTVNSGETVTVTINGSQTKFTNNPSVSISGNWTSLSPTSTSRINDTTLTAKFNIPANTHSDVCNVYVYSNSESYTLDKGITIIGKEPRIVSVTPNTASNGQTVNMLISTKYTKLLSASNISVYLDGNFTYLYSTSVTKHNDTTLLVTFTIPAQNRTDTCDISLSINWENIYLENAFIIKGIDPKIVSASPNSASSAQTVDVTINASQTKFKSSSYADISLVGKNKYTYADSVFVVNDSTINARFKISARSASDICDIVVYSYGAYYQLNKGFTINGVNAKLVSISPKKGVSGQTVDITITGQQMAFTNSSYITANLNGNNTYLTSDSIAVVNDSTINARFKISARNRSDICDISLRIDDDNFKLNRVFTIDGVNPQILSVSPNSGNHGQRVSVTMKGSQTAFMSASSISATLQGYDYINSTSVKKVNDTTIIAVFDIPNRARSGEYSISLYVDADRIYVNEYFTINGVNPQLLSISPTSGKQGQTLDIIINGTDMYFNETSYIDAYFYGNMGGALYATSTIPINNNKAKTTISIPTDAQPGTYQLNLYVDGDYYSLYDAFTVEGDVNPTTPQLVSISPGWATPGQTLDVTITGANTHFKQTSDIQIAIFSQSTYIEASWFKATSNTTITAIFDIPEEFDLGVYSLGVYSVIDGYLELLESVIINAVGLDEEENFISKLYPNPVKEKLYIETKQQVNNFTIIDITGKQITVDKSDVERNNNQYTINIDKLGLRKGIYFIKLESDSGFDYQKFIVE